QEPAGAAGYDIVRSIWRQALGQGDRAFEKSWRRALHDGLQMGSAGQGELPQVRPGQIAEAVRQTPIAANAPSDTALDVVFATSRLYDGRYANCAWLQELPEIGSMTV